MNGDDFIKCDWDEYLKTGDVVKAACDLSFPLADGEGKVVKEGSLGHLTITKGAEWSVHWAGRGTLDDLILGHFCTLKPRAPSGPVYTQLCRPVDCQLAHRPLLHHVAFAIAEGVRDIVCGRVRDIVSSLHDVACSEVFIPGLSACRQCDRELTPR